MKRKPLIEAKQYCIVTDWMKPRGLFAFVVEYPSNYPGLRTCKTIIVLYEPNCLTAPVKEMDYIPGKEELEDHLKMLATRLKSNPIHWEGK